MKISEFAERIDVFTTQFEAHINKHGLQDKVVDMGESEDCREEGKPLCNTPACHGGEIAIMYEELGLLGNNETYDFYLNGADVLSRELRITGVKYLVSDCLEEEWGNKYSCSMFIEAKAFLTPEECESLEWLVCGRGIEVFYKEVDKNTTLTKILNHWKLFSKRIKERALTDDFEIPEGYLL